MGDALLTGAFGVVVALLTWLLAGLRERSSFRRDIQREKADKLEQLYASIIEALEMSIRATESLGSYEDLSRQHSKSNALLRLLSTKEIVEQMEEASIVMGNWSTEYRRGAPKPVGNTGMSITASGDSEHSRRAAELRPALNDALVKLIGFMAAHLEKVRAAA